MRLSGMLWWIGALVFAALAGLLTYGLLTGTDGESLTPATLVETRPVVVAKTDIPFRRSITEAELSIRELPVDSIPEGAASTLDQVVGKMSSVQVFTGEPILAQQLVTPEIVTQQVALSVPDGKVVVAVPTASELIANRLINPGDSVDLLSTFELELIVDGRKGPELSESVVLIQDLEVHAIILPDIEINEGFFGSEQPTEGGVFRTPDSTAQSLLLAVDLQDALIVRHVLDTGGTLDLALRAPDDEFIEDTEPVNGDYLVEKYQIDVSNIAPSRPFAESVFPPTQ